MAAAGVMREMPIAPERLWEPEQQAQACRERVIRDAVTEERAMDEVVRDRVRIPPDDQRDEQHD